MIQIYGKKDCQFCDRAKQLAQHYNLPYQYFDAYENKERFKELFPEAKTVPQIVWNDRHIGGYDEFAGEVVNTIGGYGQGAF